MNSIYKRLVVYLAIGLGSLIAVSAFGLIYFIDLKLNERFDESVLQRAESLVTQTKIVDGEVDLDFADEFMPNFSRPEGPEYFQIWLPDGEILERSYSLSGRDLARNENPKTQFRDISMHVGGRCRQVQVMFIPQDEDADKEGEYDVSKNPDNTMVLCYAMNREAFDAFMWQLNFAIIAVFLSLFAITLFYVRLALNKGLNPLGDLKKQVSRLGPDNLHSNIVLGQETLELSPVVDQLNAMLERLNEAMERERQFTSNVAHELRTPISELRSLSEVGKKCFDRPETIERFFQEIRDTSLEMEHIIVNLLYLARCDAGTQMISKSTVNLSNLLHKVIDRHQTTLNSRALHFNNNIKENIQVQSDPIMIEQIVQNMVNNAVTHADPNSEITVSLDHSQETQITVANKAASLEQTDLTKMFDRFWQKGQARTGGKHSGLGMSLINSFAKLLRYPLSTELNDEIYTISLKIPPA